MTVPADDLDLVDALAQLSFLVQATLGELANEHGQSLVQARLLGILRDREPTMAELGRHLGLDKSSVSGLVDRAQRRGLVSRKADGADRRVVRVSITPVGRELAQTVAAAFAERLELLASDVSASDRRAVQRTARRVLDAGARSLG